MTTWFLWMEYLLLFRLVEKMLFFIFTTLPTFLSVIEWADNGGGAAAHKERATPITPPLSPLHKCVFMHGSTCISPNVIKQNSHCLHAWLKRSQLDLLYSYERNASLVLANTRLDNHICSIIFCTHYIHMLIQQVGLYSPSFSTVLHHT